MEEEEGRWEEEEGRRREEGGWMGGGREEGRKWEGVFLREGGGREEAGEECKEVLGRGWEEWEEGGRIKGRRESL